jgi:hypothetical protein
MFDRSGFILGSSFHLVGWLVVAVVAARRHTKPTKFPLIVNNYFLLFAFCSESLCFQWFQHFTC